LETYGYKVLTASDGTEAVAVYAQQMKEIDVVLVDMMMPYMDGLGNNSCVETNEYRVKIIAQQRFKKKTAGR